jgi:hypothetical protein
MIRTIYYVLFFISLFFSGCAANYSLSVAELPVSNQVISAKMPLSVGIVLHDENEQKDSVWIDTQTSYRLTLSAPSGQIINKYAYKVFSDLFEKTVLLRSTNDIQIVDALLSIEITYIHQDLIKASSGPGGKFQYTTSVSALLTDKKGIPIWGNTVKSSRPSSWSWGFSLSLDENLMAKAVTESAIVALQAASKEMRYSREIQAFSDAKYGIQATPVFAKSSPTLNAPNPQTSPIYSGISTDITASKSVGKFDVAGASAVPAIPVKPLNSDVDSLPEITTRPNMNAYAIVIGIEQYRQKLPKADYATHDAKIISEYLTKTMGYPEENVITLLGDRALKSDMEKYFDRWLSNNVEENGRVFIYYSGHGAPNTNNGDAYLVPYDGDPTFIAETGYSLARLYESLGKLKAKEILVVLDSCFSGGGGRSVLAKGAKPLVMTINKPTIQKNISVMTASSGDQISSAYEEKGHGLFTYYLLKGIKNENVIEPDGAIKIDDLFGYIKPQVERIARKQYNNEQTPQLIGAKK